MFRPGATATTSLYSPAGASDSSGFSEQRDSSFSPAPGGPQLVAPVYQQQQQAHPSNETIRIGPAGALFSLPHQSGFRAEDNSTRNDSMQQLSFQGGIDGRGSPNPGHFTYHNQALTASPYSTLPRRPGARMNPVRNMMHDIHGPIMNASNIASNSYSNPSDRHSPLMLELGSVNSFRGGPTASLGRKQNSNFSTQMSVISQPTMAMKTKVISAQRVTAKTPLLEDDRESCV